MSVLVTLTPVQWSAVRLIELAFPNLRTAAAAMAVATYLGQFKEIEVRLHGNTEPDWHVTAGSITISVCCPPEPGADFSVLLDHVDDFPAEVGILVDAKPLPSGIYELRGIVSRERFIRGAVVADNGHGFTGTYPAASMASPELLLGKTTMQQFRRPPSRDATPAWRRQPRPLPRPSASSPARPPTPTGTSSTR